MVEYLEFTIGSSILKILINHLYHLYHNNNNRIIDVKETFAC